MRSVYRGFGIAVNLGPMDPDSVLGQLRAPSPHLFARALHCPWVPSTDLFGHLHSQRSDGVSLTGSIGSRSSRGGYGSVHDTRLSTRLTLGLHTETGSERSECM